MLCISHGAAESPKKECPKGKLHSAVTVVLTVKGQKSNRAALAERSGASNRRSRFACRRIVNYQLSIVN